MLIQNLGMINNGLVQDVTRETSRDYSKAMDPALYDNHSEYSLKELLNIHHLVKFIFLQ